LDHEIFDNQDDAIQRASELFNDVKLITRKNSVAPKDSQVNGRNPTVEEILKRHQGLGDHKIRMLPTNENKWCIYWRPSTIPPFDLRDSLRCASEISPANPQTPTTSSGVLRKVSM